MTAPDYRGMLSAEAVARLVADARAEVARAVEAELTFAEGHQRQVIDDEVLAPVGAIRFALAPYLPPDATERPVSASDGSGGVA